MGARGKQGGRRGDREAIMWIFIVNPEAGNGRGRDVFERLQKSEAYLSLKAMFYYSEYEGHAEEIAHTIREDDRIQVIVVVGGDGTIHEVVNGLYPGDIPIGFIPAGSGNDFARGIGVKGSPVDILERLIKSKQTTPYWIGTYQQDKEDRRYFVNSMGFGFDAETAHIANQSFYKKVFNQFRFGTGSYVIALIQVLVRFKPRRIRIKVDGEERVYDNCWLLSVGNHPYYGGGMKIMPNALNQPNKFAVLLVHSVPKWKVLALFLTVFTGKHEKIEGVELFEASSLTIKCSEEIHTQVDGQTTTCNETIIKKTYEKIAIRNVK